MSPRDEVRLRHIRDAIESARRFASGRTRADLDRDEMLLFALTRAIQIVGEAAAKMSEESRRDIPDVPWQEIIGMRNRLVHAYMDVDLDLLWKTVMDALPPVEVSIRRALGED